MKRPSASSFSFSFATLLLFLAPVSGVHAALEKDLGQALTYLRVTDATTDAKTTIDALHDRPALVLDLRSLPTADQLASTIQTALAHPPEPRAVRIILINATTAPTLIAAITDTLPNVITIGPQTPALTPDIAIATSDENDRHAFAALATGTPLEKLINATREKRRYDEAKLVHDHNNGIAPSDPELPADAEDDTITEPVKEKTEAEKGKKTEPVQIIDLVLERAVQLHRALLALKRL